jgi:hypothetical protein
MRSHYHEGTEKSEQINACNFPVLSGSPDHRASDDGEPILPVHRKASVIGLHIHITAHQRKSMKYMHNISFL